MPLRKVPSPFPLVLYSPAFQLFMGPPRIIRDYNLYPSQTATPPLPRHSSTLQCLASAQESLTLNVDGLSTRIIHTVHLLVISKKQWQLGEDIPGKAGGELP